MSVSAPVELVLADYANPAHAQAIVDLIDMLAQEKISGGKQLEPHVRARLPQELAKRGNITVLLASFEEQFVGCAVLQEGFSTFNCKPELNIHDLIVAPHCRSQGIGAALLNEIEAVAAKKGCVVITLEVVSSNESAMDFYSRYGYRNAISDLSLGAVHYWSKHLPT